MVDSFYEGDLRVLKIERELRREVRKKLEEAEQLFNQVTEKVENAREKLSFDSECNPLDSGSSGGDS